MNGHGFGGELSRETAETIETARGLTRDAEPVLMTLARGVFAYLDHLDRKAEDVASALHILGVKFGGMMREVEELRSGAGAEWERMNAYQRRGHVARRAAAILAVHGGAFVASPALGVILVRCAEGHDADALLVHLHAIEDATALFALAERLDFGKVPATDAAQQAIGATAAALEESWPKEES